MSVKSGINLGKANEPKGGREPRPGEFVVVQCPGYRCLAVLDSLGKWHEAYSQKELPNVTKICWDL